MCVCGVGGGGGGDVLDGDMAILWSEIQAGPQTQTHSFRFHESGQQVIKCSIGKQGHSLLTTPSYPHQETRLYFSLKANI